MHSLLIAIEPGAGDKLVQPQPQCPLLICEICAPSLVHCSRRAKINFGDRSGDYRSNGVGLSSHSSASVHCSRRSGKRGVSHEIWCGNTDRSLAMSPACELNVQPINTVVPDTNLTAESVFDVLGLQPGTTLDGA